MYVEERYSGHAMAANSSYSTSGTDVYGFIAITAGTITITRDNGTVLLAAFPVTAGQIYPFRLYVGSNGGTVSLAGGASGVLLK